MRCLVTAGPTYEPLDAVRRLTNSSTGRLGTELANYLTGHGHEVTLLIGEQAAWGGRRKAAHVLAFGPTANLREQLQSLAGPKVDGVFHAAAVSDFAFGRIWRRSAAGDVPEAQTGKIATRQGALMAELVPTPKIITELRDWFPHALLVGWKYEVDGNRTATLRVAQEQISECRTDFCVANGPAYGLGFGLVTAEGACSHFDKPALLYEALEQLLESHRSAAY
jgi:phosphopantothenate---cysteine ligase (CTP)